MENIDQERKEWINKAIELAKQEKLKISEVEVYDHGIVIRFASPDNPEEEAGVYVWYKIVECFPEFGAELHSISWSGYKGELRSLMEKIVKESTGYRLDSKYDGFVKDVNTPEEAIEEVKIRIKKAIDTEKLLLDRYAQLEYILKEILQELSEGKYVETKTGIIIKEYHKRPRDIKKDEEKGIDLDKK